jgi:HAD superfamily hydrolase (TIGR01490 family)
MGAGRIGAFFDVDKTIIANNSGKLYMRELYERGEMDASAVLRNLGSYLRYKLNLLDVERWAAGIAVQLRGRSEEEFVAEGEDFFERRVRPEIYPQAAARVREHLERGHVVALVSGSTRFIVERLAAHLGVEHMLCTELEALEGVLTGRVVEPVCFGAGKVRRLQQLIARERVDLVRSYFYTDSMSDLPLLELVGHPVVVNPDPLLYREARRRRWPIEFFDPPKEAPAQASS